MKKTQLSDRRSIDILSRLLAEENLQIVHDSTASTASFNPATRILTFPTYGDQISTDAQTGLALHETGHATDSPDGDETRRLFKKYGKSVVNILEDVRIEKLVKEKFPGSKKFFARGYDELVLEHNFFGTASNENPFDFNDKSFLDRVNIHFKIGAKAMVKFTKAEQALVDEIAEIRTVEDLERLSAKLKEIAEENASTDMHMSFDPAEGAGEMGDDDVDVQYGESDDPETAEDGEESEAADGSESSESDDGEESDGSESSESDDSDGEGSDGSESDEDGDDSDGEGSDGSESDEDGDDSDGEGSESSDADGEAGSEESADSDEDGADAGEGDDGEADGEESDGDDDSQGDDGEGDESSEFDGEGDTSPSDEDTDAGDAPENDGVDITVDDLEESETEKASKEALERLARNAGMVGQLPKSVNIPDIAQPWQDIEPWVNRLIEDYGQNWGENLAKFRNEVKPVLTKMVAEFNRQAAGTVSRRTSFKDTGVLDPMKMVHYKYNDNIFKRRKYVRDGKNHGAILFVDFTGSMSRRIVPVMRQVVLMVEFCKKVNVPFRVYGWSDRYLPGSFGRDDEYGSMKGRRAEFGTVGITEVLNSEMPKAKLEKFLKWALSGKGMTPGGSTPIVSAFYHTLPLVRKFRKESSVDVMKLMFFSDGDGTANLPNWGAKSWIDEETGTQYSKSEMMDSFFKDGSVYRTDYNAQTDQQIFFLSRVLKDRYNVDTVFMFMNDNHKSYYYGGRAISQRLKNGMFTADEKRDATRSINANLIARAAVRDSYTFIVMKDGYDISPKGVELEGDVAGMTQAQLKAAFLKATVQRKSSVLFAELVAESLSK